MLESLVLALKLKETLVYRKLGWFVLNGSANIDKERQSFYGIEKGLWQVVVEVGINKRACPEVVIK